MAINNCVFMGNLGGDPELFYLPSGVAVANFSVACSRRWKDKQSGEVKEETDWVRCVAFNRRAEVIGEHFKKGSQIHVTTQMRTRTWEKDGVKQYMTEFYVLDFQFCGNRPSTGGTAQHQAQAYGHSEQPQRGQPAQQHDNFDKPFDDGIPF